MRSRSLVLWLSLAVAPTAFTMACGDDDGTTEVDSGMVGIDAGPRVDGAPGIDSGPPADDLPPVQTGDVLDGEPQLIDPATAMPADFSCMGTRTQPAGGADLSFTFTVEDFQEGNPAPDVCFEFYTDNVVPMDDGTCDGMTTDDSGNATVSDAAGSWYAYRVFPKMGPTPATTVVGSVQYNEPAPDMMGETATGNSVSQATINLIPTVLGFRRAAGTAVLAGQVQDCADDPVYGAHIRAYTADGTEIVEGMRQSDPHYRYFDGNDFPNSTQPWSHVDGLFAAANFPADAAGTPFFLELWGRLTEDGPVMLLGCEEGRLFPDTVTILNIGPLRSDGPACPSL